MHFCSFIILFLSTGLFLIFIPFFFIFDRFQRNLSWCKRALRLLGETTAQTHECRIPDGGAITWNTKCEIFGGRRSTQRKNLQIVVHHWNKDPNLPPFHHQLSPPSIKNKQPSHQTPPLPLPITLPTPGGLDAPFVDQSAVIERLLLLRCCFTWAVRTGEDCC